MRASSSLDQASLFAYMKDLRGFYFGEEGSEEDEDNTSKSNNADESSDEAQDGKDEVNDRNEVQVNDGGAGGGKMDDAMELDFEQ